MSRPLRTEYPGAVYHLTSRGNRREDIYLGDDDRERFLKVLAEVVDRFHWRCHAYCLMGNHYHLMVEITEPTLSRGMRQLNGVYTQQFNRQHDRTGHVFQGRYKSILVEKDTYLLELCRYLVLNPVRAGVTRDVAAWPWSSYAATAGMTSEPEFLTTTWLLAQFGASKTTARARYRNFVSEGGNTSSPWLNLQGQDVLGSKKFLMSLRHRRKSASSEVPRRKRYVGRLPMDVLRSTSRSREQWMSEAYRDHGYTMREIAADAGLHYSSVSKIIKAWEKSQNSTN